MSTDLHLICKAHNVQSGEVGNATRQILAVRDAIRKRKEIRDIWMPAQQAFELEWHEIHWMTTMRTCLRFVVEHAECDIEIMDEYGKFYDLSVDPEECFAWITLGNLNLICDRDQVDRHQRHIHNGTDDRGVSYTIEWHAWETDEAREIRLNGGNINALD